MCIISLNNIYTSLRCNSSASALLISAEKSIHRIVWKIMNRQNHFSQKSNHFESVSEACIIKRSSTVKDCLLKQQLKIFQNSSSVCIEMKTILRYRAVYYCGSCNTYWHQINVMSHRFGYCKECGKPSVCKSEVCIQNFYHEFKFFPLKYLNFY